MSFCCLGGSRGSEGLQQGDGFPGNDEDAGVHLADDGYLEILHLDGNHRVLDIAQVADHVADQFLHLFDGLSLDVNEPQDGKINVPVVVDRISAVTAAGRLDGIPVAGQDFFIERNGERRVFTVNPDADPVAGLEHQFGRRFCVVVHPVFHILEIGYLRRGHA